MRNPIDNFILSKLTARGFEPARPAEKVSLLRRVYYDLTGLPPTPEEVDAFLADDSRRRLRARGRSSCSRRRNMASAGRGTGSTWCATPTPTASSATARSRTPGDIATTSFARSTTTSRTTSSSASNWPATSWTGHARHAHRHRLLSAGLWDDEPADPLQARYDELDDIVATTSQVFLGLTVNCARCHDHKLDPIPQADYYRLLAFFNEIDRYKTDNSQSDISSPELAAQHQAAGGSQSGDSREDDADRAIRHRQTVGRGPAQDRRARTRAKCSSEKLQAQLRRRGVAANTRDFKQQLEDGRGDETSACARAC